MNKKEIGEIRRHTRRDRSNITKLYGCFVNDQKEVISKFQQSVGIMPENESDKFFQLLKKNLSGAPGKNLIDIPFSVQQVTENPEHALLMQLRESRLEDEESLEIFYQKVIESVDLDMNYLILIGCDSYDVPFRSKDDTIQNDESNETYRYLLCGICPVKPSKAVLEYKATEQEFHDSGIANQLSAPVLGFLFPAFDDRSTNIYDALLYTKDAGDNHENFVKSVFNAAPQMAADEQKRNFKELLGNTLDTECSLDVVQAVYNELDQMIQLHKESKSDEPLLFDKDTIKNVLANTGVSEEKISKFSVEYDTTFGEKASLPPKNMMETKQFEITIPDLTIRMRPDRSDLVETRVIDGVKYIMICAEDAEVAFNGININITDE